MTNHPKFTESHDSAARSVGYEGAREVRCNEVECLCPKVSLRAMFPRPKTNGHDKKCPLANPIHWSPAEDYTQ